MGESSRVSRHCSDASLSVNHIRHVECTAAKRVGTRLLKTWAGDGCSNLVGNVGPRLADIAVHLAHDANVFITVEKRVFLFALNAHVTSTGV